VFLYHINYTYSHRDTKYGADIFLDTLYKQINLPVDKPIPIADHIFRCGFIFHELIEVSNLYVIV